MKDTKNISENTWMRTVKTSLKNKTMEKMRESLVYNQRCYNVKIIKPYWVDADIERR